MLKPNKFLSLGQDLVFLSSDLVRGGKQSQGWLLSSFVGWLIHSSLLPHYMAACLLPVHTEAPESRMWSSPFPSKWMRRWWYATVGTFKVTVSASLVRSGQITVRLTPMSCPSASLSLLPLCKTSLWVAQMDLKFTIFLPPSPRGRGYRPAPPWLAILLFLKNAQSPGLE